jgi:hypothetical protein
LERREQCHLEESGVWGGEIDREIERERERECIRQADLHAIEFKLVRCGVKAASFFLSLFNFSPCFIYIYEYIYIYMLCFHTSLHSDVSTCSLKISCYHTFTSSIINSLRPMLCVYNFHLYILVCCSTTLIAARLYSLER